MENATSKKALIVAGGRPIETSVLARLDLPAWTVAADSGLDQTDRLGIRPDLVVGDMDSVTPAALARAEAAGVTIARHPADKDATDLELAIDAAIAHGHAEASIIGGTGGRMAHTLANALLLTRRRDIHLEWITSRARITALFAGDTATFDARDGDLVSVLAVGEEATCSSRGLKWPLADEPLIPGSTRGLSNQLSKPSAAVTVVAGQVLIIHERD